MQIINRNIDSILGMRNLLNLSQYTTKIKKNLIYYKKDSK